MLFPTWMLFLFVQKRSVWLQTDAIGLPEQKTLYKMRTFEVLLGCECWIWSTKNRKVQCASFITSFVRISKIFVWGACICNGWTKKTFMLPKRRFWNYEQSLAYSLAWFMVVTSLPNPAWLFLENVVFHMIYDPFVIITPRFYSMPTSSQRHPSAHIRRMRSACNHHSKILQHIIASSADRTHTHTHTHTTYANHL